MTSDSHILIRYIGGTGGETLNYLLSKHFDIVDGNVTTLENDSKLETSYNHRNSIESNETFDKIFLDLNPRPGDKDRYLLPDNTHWMVMDDDIIKKVVADKRMSNPNSRVGIMHYTLSPNLDYHSVFPNTFIIDLFRSSGNNWITKCLHFYKSAIYKEYRLPDRVPSAYPDYNIIINHHAKHGWYPRWWVWFVDQPIGTFEQLLELKFNLYTNNGNSDAFRWSPSSDFYIDGGKFAVDETNSKMLQYCIIG